MHQRLGFRAPMEGLSQSPAIDEDDVEATFAKLCDEELVMAPVEYMKGYVEYIFLTSFYTIDLDSLQGEDLAFHNRALASYEKFKSILSERAIKLQRMLQENALKSKNKDLVIFLAHLGETLHTKMLPGDCKGEKNVWKTRSKCTWRITLNNTKEQWLKTLCMDRKHAQLIRWVHCLYFFKSYVELILHQYAEEREADLDMNKYSPGQILELILHGACSQNVADWNDKRIDLLIRMRGVFELSQSLF